MSWTEKDLQVLKAKGMKIDDSNCGESAIIKPKKKIVKISIEKRAIEFWLEMFKRNSLITDFKAEHQFHDVRQFRFDWAVLDLKIAIEYEGIHSKKSGHTTISGYNKDIEKYNLALMEGWKVLRYTANNYKSFEKDFLRLINKCNEPIEGYCRLHLNGAITEKCSVPCNSCITASPDDLLKSNFNL